MAVPLSLEGRGALVTGGCGGIGTAVVGALLEAGARVAVLDRPGTPAPGGASFHPCDLGDPASLRAAFAAAVGSLGGSLHALVHCAGITRDAMLWRMEDADWDLVLRVNLGSAFLLLKEAAPHLRKAGDGAVVLVSSINGQRGKAGQANYAASKAGLHALAMTAARELGRSGTRVNAVAPGFVTTAMTDRVPEEFRRKAVEETVLGRPGAPADVAHAVLFLCSPLAGHVTGQVLRVDGGQLMA